MEMEASAMKHLDLAAAERHAFRRPQQKVRREAVTQGASERRPMSRQEGCTFDRNSG